jgi:hypothetical protein
VYVEIYDMNIYFSVNVLSTERCCTKLRGFIFSDEWGKGDNVLYSILIDVILSSRRKCFNQDSTNMPLKINTTGTGRVQAAY